MIVAEPRTPALNGTTQARPDLRRAVRSYVRAYASLHGRRKAAEDLGVSRHTLWRFLDRGHTGRSVPSAVLNKVGGSVRAIEAATFEIIIDLEGLRPDPALRHLRQGLEEALLLLCATPLATVEELSRFGRIPASTLRDRLKRLTELGLVDSVPHHLSAVGTRPQRRYFPTEKGVTAAGAATKGRAHMLRSYPVSKQWFRLLAERLDAVAELHRVAAMVADADPHDDSVRVDHYRNGPYDMLLTLSGGRSIGLIRQGPALPTSRLRYRLRSIERLDSSDTPFVTLVLTHADQATRRAIRSLGDPSEYRRTFVATEGELLAGDHTGAVWQQCGSGLGEAVRIDADASLAGILAWAERLLDSPYSFLRDRPKPNRSALYPSGVQAAMPEPTEQLTSSLSVQLTRAEKDALDLLAAWPLCTREQLAGLMGGVTLRRGGGGQPGAPFTLPARPRASGRASAHAHRRGTDVLGPQGPGSRGADPRPLERRASVPERRHLRRDRRACPGLSDASPRRRRRPALSAEVARSPDHDLWDLLPTSRSSIGYRYDWTTYVIHPDASFTLEYEGRWRPYLLEFERRATTPKRARARLKSYRRYFDSGWAERDHEGRLPRVLFVFESPSSENAFLDVADTVKGVPIITSNAKSLAKRGILGDAWILPPPQIPHLD